MYITVKILNGLATPLTYAVPKEWNTKDLVGSLVTVPLQKRTALGLVTHINTERPVGTFTIKKALSQEMLPHDPYYHAFLQTVAQYHALDVVTLYKRIKHMLTTPALTDITYLEDKTQHSPSCTLTAEQQAIIDGIFPSLHTPLYQPFLLHGVTGSGKTEIYKKCIEENFKLHKTTLFLVPEVSLALRLTHILRTQLPSYIPLYTFHSASSATEKKDVWQQLHAQRPLVLVGVHLPVLLPLPQLGLIIVDEEHDTSFQSQQHPRINARDAALLRAQAHKIPILLGSATPSLNALWCVQTRGWKLFELTHRFKGAFPTVHVVPLRNKEKRASFWISTQLQKALTDRLNKKEQSIIFLNRRGVSFFIQCSGCGFIPHCTTCSVSLTLHEDETLRCHYCNAVTQAQRCCSGCSAPEHMLIKKGIGTQHVVQLLKQLFPQAKIARADLDSTINKKKWTSTLQSFDQGEIDILVGTQTITKGYHFPRVTLVGILWADINLSIPFYNASEITLQQLIQVAGRAGRESAESLVIVQTMAEHPLYTFINEQSYKDFYTYELPFRQELMYPPYARLAVIELRNTDSQQCCADAQTFTQALFDEQTARNKHLVILGPTQPPVHKIKNSYSYVIYLKSMQFADIIDIFTATRAKTPLSSMLFFTPHPLR